MTVLVQLSDPHLQVGGDDRGAARALEAAVAAVLALRPAPDAVLVSGDLGDAGSADEYARARELLAPLPMPVHVLPGNHDDPEALGAAFGARAGGWEPYSASVGGIRLVVCDTTVPGRMEGSLDRERRARLEAELDAARGGPVIVAMHHPPLLTGIPVLEEIGLPPQDRAALGELLARSPHVRRVVAGHVHRTAFAQLGGCGVVTAPSTNLQARLELGARAFDFRPEPAGFLVHAELEGELVTHVQPVARPG
jgi:3',5'-cyclic AMP phosphodiesterase CpdA